MDTAGAEALAWCRDTDVQMMDDRMDIDANGLNDVAVTLKEDSHGEISFTYSCNKANLSRCAYFKSMSNFKESSQDEWTIIINTDNIYQTQLPSQLLPSSAPQGVYDLARKEAVAKILDAIFESLNGISDTENAPAGEAYSVQILNPNRTLLSKQNFIVAHYLSMRISYDEMVEKLEEYLLEHLLEECDPIERWLIYDYIMFSYQFDARKVTKTEDGQKLNKVIARILESNRYDYLSREELNPRSNEDYDFEEYAKYISTSLKQLKIANTCIDRAVIGLHGNGDTFPGEKIAEESRASFVQRTRSAPQLNLSCLFETPQHPSFVTFCARNEVTTRSYIPCENEIELEGVFDVTSIDDSNCSIFEVAREGLTIKSSIIIQNGEAKMYFDIRKEHDKTVNIDIEVDTVNNQHRFVRSKTSARILSLVNIASTEPIPIQVERQNKDAREILLWKNEEDYEVIYKGDLLRNVDIVAYKIKFVIKEGASRRPSI